MVQGIVCFPVTMVLLLYGAALQQVESASSEVHLKLLGDLMDNYTKPFMRPVNETTNTVNVGLRYTPIFSTLDETEEVLKVRGTFLVKWDDYRLQWLPADYDNISETKIPLLSNDEQKVWIPEIILFECLVTDFHSFYPETTEVTLFHTGQIYWYTLATTKTYCMMDNTNFPFDNQTCNLTFTTWLYNSGEQTFYIIDDLVVNDTYKKYELKNALWTVEIENTEVNTSTYDCETCNGEKQSYARYTLELTRGQPVLLLMIFYYPCLVISGLLMVVPFLPYKVDADAPSYALTCVMTLFVCLTFLYTRLPATGAAAIGFYITAVIAGGILAVVIAVLKNPGHDTLEKVTAPAQNEQEDGIQENDANNGSDRIRLMPIVSRNDPTYGAAQNSGSNRRMNRSTGFTIFGSPKVLPACSAYLIFWMLTVNALVFVWAFAH